ncbi:MFS transporter [Agreia pratensis]|uniref:MFS transporter, CP family, cyanate transporter n=1 Tax=Agreia pratensis TaxID=150121 RepID=A0A1X7K113_9MICO|nr:MFS transporter [Agreia pratensis]SMG34549.1 MFS transporter, CP family, cyanate transporter [Agreia pratensis]
MRTRDTRSVARAMPWFLLVAVVLFALNLRGPIVAIAPVIGQIRDDLGLSAATAGLLTSLPVLCFALATPLAAALIARAGPERAVLISLAGILVGTLIRAQGGFAVAVIGTLVIGIAITVGNVVVPVVVRRDFPASRVGIVTGVYTATLNVGAMLTSLCTAPLAEWLGWRAAITAWAVLLVAAIIIWGQAAGWRRSVLGERVTAPDSSEAPPAHSASYRSLTAWLLMLAFGGQAFSYYGITTWLPTILHEVQGLDDKSAGASSSVFQVLAVVGALGVPVLANRWRPGSVVGLVGTLWLAMPLGLLLAPELWPLWSVVGGAAQGGGITIVFIIIVRMSTSNDQARGMSAFVQGGGYLLASTGPSIVGAVHEASGGWTAPLIVVTASVLVLLIFGITASARVESRHP